MLSLGSLQTPWHMVFLGGGPCTHLPDLFIFVLKASWHVTRGAFWDYLRKYPRRVFDAFQVGSGEMSNEKTLVG